MMITFHAMIVMTLMMMMMSLRKRLLNRDQYCDHQIAAQSEIPFR